MDARGLRNNNPANLKDFGIPWVGKVGTDEGGFVQFASPEAGFRAAARNLQTHYQRGQRTIRDIISSHAPDAENDTESYIKNVAKWTGLDPNKPFDLTEENVTKLLTAMTRQENGKSPYNPSQILTGVQAAFRGLDTRGFGNQFSGPVSPQDLAPDVAPSVTDQRDLEARMEQDRPSIVEAAQLAAHQDWATNWLFRDNAPVPTNLDFRWQDHPDELKEITKGVPNDDLHLFEDARSLEHARWLRQQYDEDQANEAKLASLGAGGVALRLGVGLVDPVGLAIGAATGGLGKVATMGRELGAVSRVALASLEAGAAGAGYAGIMRAKKPTFDDEDMAHVALYSLGLGGAFGLLAKNPATAEEAKTLQDATRRALTGHEAPVEGSASSSVGAAQTPSYLEPLARTTDELAIAAKAAAPKGKSLGARFRFSTAAQGASSPNPLTRTLMGALVEDAGADVTEKVRFSTSEEKSRIHLYFENQLNKALKPAWYMWRKEQGLNWTSNFSQSKRAEFHEAAAAAVRDRMNGEVSPAIQKARDGFRSVMKEYRDLLQNPGLWDGSERNPVRGFEHLEPNDYYVPRVFDLQKVRSVLQEYGNASVVKMVSEGMRAAAAGASNPMSKDLADKFATAYVRRLQGMTVGEQTSTFRALSGEDVEQLRNLMADTFKAHGEDVSDEELSKMVDWLKTKDERTQAGESTRAKQRLLIDDNWRSDVTNIAGETKSLGLSDLLNNNLEEVGGLYNHQMSGLLALNRLRIVDPGFAEGLTDKPYLIDGIHTKAQAESVLNKVRQVADREGVGREQIEKDVANLKWVFDRIFGVPDSSSTSRWAPMLRAVRDYNFMRVMGQSGFAQLPEVVNIPAQLGVKAFLSNLPSFRMFIRDAMSGELVDPKFQELERIVGLGADVDRMHLGGIDIHDVGTLSQVGSDNQLVKGFQAGAEYGRKITAIASGMMPFTAMMHRMTMGAIYDKFILGAFGKEGWNIKRLHQVGLDQEALERIFGEIRKHSTKVANEDGRNTRVMNTHLWDPQTRYEMENAIFRWTRKIIQENDLGQMHRFMSNELAKSLLQFRTFMVGAYDKQFYGNLRAGSFETTAVFLSQMFAASLVYAAQTHLNGVGRSDREEYLKQALSPQNIALAGFQRAGWSSIFPMAADSMIAPLNNGQGIFNFRTTGQPSDMFFGNPTTGFINDFYKAAKGGVDLATGKGNQSDVRAITRLGPLQNFLPVTMLTSLMVKDLEPPHYSQQK
jgi:hypothetical protein